VVEPPKEKSPQIPKGLESKRTGLAHTEGWQRTPHRQKTPNKKKRFGKKILPSNLTKNQTISSIPTKACVGTPTDVPSDPKRKQKEILNCGGCDDQDVLGQTHATSPKGGGGGGVGGLRNVQNEHRVRCVAPGFPPSTLWVSRNVNRLVKRKGGKGGVTCYTTRLTGGPLKPHKRIRPGGSLNLIGIKGELANPSQSPKKL